ncbi:MAG: hypothetical protein ACKVQC_05620 [Elusimicrobiota bacterium]
MKSRHLSVWQTTQGLSRLVVICLVTAILLFFHVLWPIQVERSHRELKAIEKKISEKKSELNELKVRYGQVTSLGVLDAWAKQHGPWKSPQAGDVVTIR